MNPFRESGWDRRAFLVGSARATTLFAASGLLPPDVFGNGIVHQGATVEPTLELLIKRYMGVMCAPGLTLGMLHANGRATASSFGLSDVARNMPVKPEMLFQIGSISKSFCALVLLQMREEGKLDLHKPILDYLSWLPIDAPYGEITVHHLLTHSSGLPRNSPLFLSDRNARIRQGFKPGTQFHYSNLGFSILGHMASTMDGHTYTSVLQKRILDPLGMTTTRPAISNAIRSDEAQSYVFYRDDLSGGSQARLEVAPRAVYDHASGCVASTPEDMTRYMRMLVNRGKGPNGPLISEESFALFTSSFIEADEFGKGANYGYGIAVDMLDGHKVIRHTGGMPSFASSMQVDLDNKLGAFVSINAMQGYRPNPVAKYALQVMRAEADAKPVPQPEAIDNPREIENAADYAGAYAGEGSSLQVIGEGKSLFVLKDGNRIRLARTAGDKFAAEDPAWQRFPWVFSRGESEKSDAKKPVTELMFGPAWWANAAYRGPKVFASPKRFERFTGCYDSETSGFEVVICKGRLFAGGDPFVEIGHGLFQKADEPESPETIEFLHVVNGRSRMALVTGTPLWRIELE
jgi:CubicO group peptidase (beta-lactamase class C family)